MEKRYEIYKITNDVTGKIYIGQTCCGVKKRWIRHKSNARRGATFYLHKSLRKYGVASFKIEVIATALQKDFLDDLEVTLISQYNSLTPNGYNLTSGGSTHTNVSEETKRKMSAAQKGNINGRGNLGKRFSAERKEKIRLAGLGRKHSSETKRKMSAAHKGLLKGGMVNPGSRGFVKTPFGSFDSCEEAAKSHECVQATVSRRCNRTAPQWSEWYFEYSERKSERNKFAGSFSDII